MNESIMQFLDSIDTKTKTTFKKETNEQGIDGVSTISVDKTGHIATTGWCKVDDFPDETFAIEPSRLKWLLSMGKRLIIQDNMLVAEDSDIQARTFWRLELAQIKSVQVEYDVKPFIIPSQIVSLLNLSTQQQPKDFVFEIKDKILTLTIEYEPKDKITKVGEHTMVRFPVDLQDQKVTFDGSISTILQLLKGDSQMLFGGQEKPSQITVNGDGFVVYHYIAPIADDTEEDENDME